MEGLKNAKLAAADIASSRSATEAGGKAWRIVHHVTNSPFMKAVSRVLVCLYFVNLGEHAQQSLAKCESKRACRALGSAW